MPSLGMDPMEMARSHDTGIAAAGASMAASIESVGGSMVASLQSFGASVRSFGISFGVPFAIFVGGLVIVVGGLACTVVYYKFVAPEISRGLRKKNKEEEEATVDAITKVYIPVTILATTIIAGGLGAWYFFKRG